MATNLFTGLQLLHAFSSVKSTTLLVYTSQLFWWRKTKSRLCPIQGNRINLTVNRARINSVEGELVDGEGVIIHLKDRSKTLSEDEREWYERAFGKKRNMMSFEARYVPLTQQSWMKGSQDIYLHLKYKMYPEMFDEFNPRQYDEFRDVKIKMSAEEDDNENFFYKFKKEFPYGDLEWEYLHRQKDNDHDEFQKLLTTNPHNNLDYIKATKKPTPVSADQQRLLDQAEEEENKKKEHEARMA